MGRVYQSFLRTEFDDGELEESLKFFQIFLVNQSICTVSRHIVNGLRVRPLLFVAAHWLIHCTNEIKYFVLNEKIGGKRAKYNYLLKLFRLFYRVHYCRYVHKCRLMRCMLFMISITKCPLSQKSPQNTHNSAKYEVIWKWHFVMLILKEYWISLTCISGHKCILERDMKNA